MMYKYEVVEINIHNKKMHKSPVAELEMDNLYYFLYINIDSTTVRE